jgi:hypothetical protein
MLLHYHSEAQNRHRLSTFHYMSDGFIRCNHTRPRAGARIRAADLAQPATIRIYHYFVTNNEIIKMKNYSKSSDTPPQLFNIFFIG